MDPRQKSFRQAREAELKRIAAEYKAAANDVRRTMAKAREHVDGILADAPSEYGEWRGARVQESIDAALARMDQDLADQAAARQAASWTLGRELVDNPLAAAGVELGPVLPAIDTRQLAAMRKFMVGKLKDVTRETATAIRDQLGLVLTGATPVSDAVAAITPMVESKRYRALAIVRTEVGRAYSTASHERQLQARKVLPGMKKQWRKSGKANGRVDHMLADGQVRKLDEPFDVGGASFMHPRSEDCPVGHAVNCGCVSLPYMESWEMQHPGEIKSEEPRSKSEAVVSAIQKERNKDWLEELVTADKPRVAGDWRTVGVIPDTVNAKLEERGLAPVSREIAISDRRVRHMLPQKAKRQHKAVKGLPKAAVVSMQEHLAKPDAVVLERSRNQLLYVFELPELDSRRVGVIPVQLRDPDAKARKLKHNWVQTGRQDDRKELKNATARYEILEGEL